MRADWYQEGEVAAEFIDHARAIRAEARRRREGRKPQLAELLRRWGGATIVYRRRLIDSPSYTLNHEEVAKALEEGISFAERLSLEEVLLDRFGWAHALRLHPTPRPTATRARRRSTSSCRRARSWSPPARSPTPCSGARSRST